MKTSQYILISFFGFLIAAVLVLYIDSLRVYDDNRIKSAEYRTTIPPKNLEHFSSIVAGANSNIQIIQDSTNSLSMGFTMANIPPELAEYEIVNDTLFILDNDARARTQTVIRCRSLHSIIGKRKSNISLNRFNTDSLSIHLNESNLRGPANKENTFDFLNIELQNSSVLSLSGTIDNVIINSDTTSRYSFRSRQ